MKKKRVFITGVTGNMGRSAMEQILASNKFDVRVLARDSATNRKKLAKYIGKKGFDIVWGDLVSYDDILKGVTGADYVLHIGGIVSPMADKFPELTMKVNVNSAKNIVKAVQAQPNKDEIAVVYIGSVAQTGFRPFPIHWGRTGDPICSSILDYYSVSKIVAETIFAESGLKKWVSIRQSGMLYSALLFKGSDPITFHVPVDGVLEWTTIEDSGKAMLRVCEDGLPVEFWRRFYNLGSGESFRMTNYEFEDRLMRAIGAPKVEKVFELDWFCTKNFHGQWYEDSDVLEEYLHFREGVTSEQYFERMKGELPWYFSLTGLAPAPIIKYFMKKVAQDSQLGTLSWLRNGDEQRIKAYFGSREEQEKIGTWKNFTPPAYAKNQKEAQEKGELNRFSHGYDEKKPIPELTIEDIREVAEFRGGKLISENMTEGDIYTALEWECAEGHRFKLSPNAVIRGGHWCPDCLPTKVVTNEGHPWNFEQLSMENPFFAQLFRKQIK